MAAWTNNGQTAHAQDKRRTKKIADTELKDRLKDRTGPAADRSGIGGWLRGQARKEQSAR